MTQRRNDPDRLSNTFDRILAGLAPRGCSFTDIDALTHDMVTDRYLFQEFKRPGEAIPVGQGRVLRGLSRREWITVWCVRLRDDGLIDWYDVGADRRDYGISVAEYQRRYVAWWKQQPIDEAAPVITAGDIPWGR